MQLSRALFCCACNEITEERNCPRCGTADLVGLWRFLPYVTPEAVVMRTSVDTNYETIFQNYLCTEGIEGNG